MKQFLAVCFLCAAVVCVSAQPCIIHPAALTVSASDACFGVWSELRAREVPPDPLRPPLPPEEYISLVISENDPSAIPSNQTLVTVVITAPNGWEFLSNDMNPAHAFTSLLTDITIPPVTGVSVTATEIVLTFSSDANADELDNIYLCNVLAKPVTGLISDGGPVRAMLRLTDNPGTAVLDGVDDTVPFGILRMKPGDIWNGGRVEFANRIPDVKTCDDISANLVVLDCAGNPSTVNLPTSLVADVAVVPLGAPGTNSVTVDFGTDYGNGMATARGLYAHIAGTYALRADCKGFPDASTNHFQAWFCGADHLTWVRQPVGGMFEGLPLQTQPVLQLRDAWENPSPIPGTTVTLTLDATMSINPNDPGAIANGTLTVPIDADGNAVFTDLQIASLSLGPFVFDATCSAIPGAWWKSDPFGFLSQGPTMPVVLNANRNGNEVLLAWGMSMEYNTLVFEVQRAQSYSPDWMTVGVVQAAGMSKLPTSYLFMDVPPPDMMGSILLYRIRLLYRDGTEILSNVAATYPFIPRDPLEVDVMPGDVGAGGGVIILTLPSDGAVTVRLYDVAGRVVSEVLSTSTLPAGKHLLPFRCASLARGTYFVQVRAETGTVHKRILVR